MEQLARIEAQLHSLHYLSSLVAALRSMAASRAREAQNASAGTRAYCTIVARAIAAVMPHEAEGQGHATANEATLLLVASENGFVGGFNARLAKHAASSLQPGERVVVVGRRGRIAADEIGLPVAAAFSMASRTDGVTMVARRIAAQLSGVGCARIVCARPGTGGVYTVETRSILPLGTPTSVGRSMSVSPATHLPAARLLQELASEYLFAAVADALMENLASENGARLLAMDAAWRNIDDRLQRLRRDERAARQEATTADLLEVVTGAEAVNHRCPGMRAP